MNLPTLIVTVTCGVSLAIGGWNIMRDARIVGAEQQNAAARDSTDSVPQFEWDPSWPKPLPNYQKLGQTAGVTIDSRNHVWVVHRPATLGAPAESVTGDTSKLFGNPAPPILEFDQAGNLLQGFGGPGAGYDWPAREHGITIDYKNNIWIGDAGGNVVLKFSPEREFLLQIGSQGKNGGSNDQHTLGRPAGVVVDERTNEAWIADGYGNRRVVVFDADTGSYKRHFGAYGKRPDDAFRFNVGYQYLMSSDPPLPQFNVVHSIAISRDGLVYVCDRANGRIQVFNKNGSYVQEFVIKPRVAADIAFSADSEQRFMYIGDFMHEKVWILRRADGRILGSFGAPGHFGGQFTVVHGIAVDQAGNIYVTESLEGKRVQRFLYKGMGAADPAAVEPPRQPEGRFEAKR